MNPVEIIAKKRDGEKLSPDEIRFIIRGAADGSIPDYQMAAFLMAYYFQDMELGNLYYDELAELTLEIARSGDLIDLSDEFDVLFDKHSTGGVGDKLSFICGPIMAACDCPSFLLSGRGLGHTGGTLDKMEAVPGTRVMLERSQIVAGLKQAGLVISGQTGSIAPADKKLYALRDVTATVPSVGLISASILGKKLAVKPTCIVLDVKTGAGAFMKRRQDARKLAETMQGILKEVGRPAVSLITRMEQPLGRMVGNSLEIQESIRALQNPRDPELSDVVEIGSKLAAHAVSLGHKIDIARAEERTREALESGRAFEKFVALFEAQGGDVSTLEDPRRLPQAAERIPVAATENGFVANINSYEIGIASNLLGAGRFRADEDVDPAVGIELVRKTGEPVQAGDPLLYLHVNGRDRLEEAQRRVLGAYSFQEEKPTAQRNILNVID